MSYVKRFLLHACVCWDEFASGDFDFWSKDKLQTLIRLQSRVKNRLYYYTITDGANEYNLDVFDLSSMNLNILYPVQTCISLI